MTPWVTPVVLEGSLVRLEPLSRAHLDGLAAIAFDPLIWRFTIARPADRAGLESWLEAALANAAAGAEGPVATIDPASGRPTGSRRFMSVVPVPRRLRYGLDLVLACRALHAC